MSISERFARTGNRGASSHGAGPVLRVPDVSIETQDDGGGVFGLSKMQLAVAVVVGGVALMVVIGAAAAGAFFLVTSGSDADLDLVPAESDTVTYVNVDQATSDEAIREVVDTYLQLRAESEFYSGPTTMDESLASFEAETGLDPDALHHATSFSAYDEATGEGAGEYSGTIVRSDWSEVDVVRAVERDSDVRLRETEYKGVTVYEPEEVRTGTSAWMAVLGDGKFVFGTEIAVKDVIDVQQGDREAFSGELRTNFEETRSGYIRFASRVPESQIPDREIGQGVDASQYRSVEMVSGAYYTSGNTLGVETTMHAKTESDAKDVMDVTDGGISLLTGLAENETVKSTLRDVEVTRSGADVTITYENAVEDLKLVLEALSDDGEDDDVRTNVQAGASVAADADEDSVRTTWTSNQNADHLVVDVRADGEPVDRKRLTEVGEQYTYVGEDGSSVLVRVTAVADDQRTVIIEKQVEL